MPAGGVTAADGSGARALAAARWIRPGEQRVQLPRSAAYLARRGVTLAGTVRRATLYATALGVYELSVNGTRVGDALLRPGWTDYARRLQYQTYDVASLLVTGPNVVGATVAPGWYAGKIRDDPGAHRVDRPPELLAALEVETDAGTLSVVTDEAWEWRGSEVLSSDLYDGDTIDRRLAVPGWSAPSAGDLGQWEAVELSLGTSAPLVPEVGPPVRETSATPAASVTWLDDGIAVVDLGRNESGYLRLQVDAPPGTRVRVSYGELLDVDGHVYVENLRDAACTDAFFCAGGGAEELAPRFTFRGARYAQVSGLAGKDALLSAERVVVGTDVERVGWFESSDQLLNDIYACVLTSQRANFLEVPTDCPQRNERLGWMADALLFSPLAAYNYDISEFLAKWFDDVLDARTAAGGFTDVAPCPGSRVGFRKQGGAPAWADAGVLIPWLVYQRYGRRDLLARMFPAMVDWLRIVHGDNPDGVWRHGLGRDYGDWVPAGPDTSHDLFATAWLAHSTAVAARVAEVLGASTEQAWLEERANAARAAFGREFVDADAGRVRALVPVGSPVAARRFAPAVAAETQTGYILALIFDLGGPELQPRFADRLAELVADAGGCLQTGFIGSALLLDALTKGGRPETAVDLLLREEYPSLGYMVNHGATSIWERWDGIQPDNGGPASATMNSFNHYCLGSMFSWAIESLCGLQPDGVAFSSFSFAPTATPRVEWTKFRFASPAGDIAVGWQLTGDGVTGEVTVPEGSRCRIAREIRLGTKTARLETDLGDADGAVGAGTYQVTWRP